MKLIALISLALIVVSCGEMKRTDKTLVIGHRGAMGHVTENTLASVQKAMDLGVDMIEIDVFKIKSGEIMVFHDVRVDKLTNGTGKIEDFNFLEVRQLTLDGNHKIPLLQDVIKLIDNKIPLNIELKGANTADRVNHIVNVFVEQHGWDPENFIISSFNWEELREMRSINPEIAIAVLTDDDPLQAIGVAKELKAIAINPGFGTLTPGVVQKIQDEGFKVYSWTVNEQDDIKKAQEMGVDGIFTNYPERID
ncbi:MAG: glycerophosphodiester phosphodiesterase [Eudoraea sp.]|nr:glycerophosphodiester phosphodiesterase [Eudoraea sp.]